MTIAHRLSTIVDSDVILVLERGRIVERGTHVALLASGGVYARMWRLQQDEERTVTEASPMPSDLAGLEVADPLRTPAAQEAEAEAALRSST